MNSLEYLKGVFVLFFLPGFFSPVHGQTYAPPAGTAGTSAIFKDSAVFVSWATACSVVRGFQDISNTSSGYATAGDSSMATGKALSNGVVSLGDGGSATCTFMNPISNGPGFDFAVFENSIDNTFLELAFVEVSSDGINFFRFPAHSLTDTNTQTGSFGSTDATRINNLAGKYRAGYGTPFDLQELSSQSSLNISAITHVKIIDVVGSMNPSYATRDSYHNKVNDPWPTPFPQGGFDLDAIGVINQLTVTGIQTIGQDDDLVIFPNPASAGNISILCGLPVLKIEIYDLAGHLIYSGSDITIDISDLEKGLKAMLIHTSKGIVVRKLVIG